MVHSALTRSIPTAGHASAGSHHRPLSYTVKDAATVIGVSHRTLWRLISNKEIPTFKLGCRTLIRADNLESFIDEKSRAA